MSRAAQPTPIALGKVGSPRLRRLFIRRRSGRCSARGCAGQHRSRFAGHALLRNGCRPEHTRTKTVGRVREHAARAGREIRIDERQLRTQRAHAPCIGRSHVGLYRRSMRADTARPTTRHVCPCGQRREAVLNEPRSARVAARRTVDRMPTHDDGVHPGSEARARGAGDDRGPPRASVPPPPVSRIDSGAPLSPCQTCTSPREHGRVSLEDTRQTTPEGDVRR